MDDWRITCKKINEKGEKSEVKVDIDDKGNGK
jgi:hypothetical protein